MRRPYVLLLLVLSFLSASGAFLPARGADTLSEVKKKGVLVVGVRPDTPPMGFIERETGRIVGVEPDLAAAVAKRIGVRLELRPLSAEERGPALLGGDVDLLAASMFSTIDRDKVMDFSNAYFRTTQKVLARKGAVSSVEGLKGKRVATPTGSASEKSLRENVPGAVCMLYTDSAKAVEALKKGEVDAISASGSALYGCLQDLPKDEYEVASGVNVAEQRYRFAVRKGDKALLAQVNETLAALADSGEAKKILDRWLQPVAPADVAKGAPPAIGAVSRNAGVPGRFVVIPFRGIFRVGAEVSFLDPQGTPVGKGKVANLYEDEVYVDGENLPAGMPQIGYPVTMNTSTADAKSFIDSRAALFTGVKAEAKKEADQRAREEGERFDRENKERERYQEDMTKSKMYLDYQYSDEYYRYWRPYYWP